MNARHQLIALFSLILLLSAFAFAQQHDRPQQAPASPQAQAGQPLPGQDPAHPVNPKEAEHAAQAHHDFVVFGVHLPAWVGPLFKWINLLGFAILLWYVLRAPMAQFFAGRSAAVAEGLASGRRARDEAAARLREIEARLSGLEQEIGEMKATAMAEAQAERQRLLASARAEAEKILALAEQEVAALGKAAQAELRAHAADLAVKLAGERIESSLTPERHAALLREYAARLARRQ